MKLPTFDKKIEKIISATIPNENLKFGSRIVEGGPKHVAIICDGNRRWAVENGCSVEEGHATGADNILRLLERAGELGVETLTVWVMDTKNLKKRSKEEVRNLLKLFLYFAMKFKREYISRDIRFRHLGAREFLPRRIQKIIRELEEETVQGGTTMNVAFNYGGRDELVRMVKQIVEDGVDPATIDSDLLAQYLDTKGQSDPDMIIRTGKDLRLSGFMPWQSESSELFFPNYYFPDFTPDRFEEVVTEFPHRSRRFGA